MTKSRIFLYFCLAFIAGVAAASFISTPVILLWGFFVLAALLIVFGVSGVSKSRTWKFQNRDLIVCGFCLLFFIFGIWRFMQKTDFVSGSLGEYINKPVMLNGVIADEPVQKEKTQEIIIEESATKNKILIRAKKYPVYGYGETLSVNGLLKEPASFSPDFDYKAYLAKDDIFFVLDFPLIKIKSSAEKDLYYYLFRLKRAFSQNINAVLPEPHASFLAGLLLGEKRNIPADLTEDFRKSGTSHIVALSGYNITIVADAIMKFLGIFTLSFSVSFWFSAIIIILFTLLTGASASVVRAAVMGILVLVARREGRLYNIRNALVLAGAVMLFNNPKVLRFDSGFQLSFLATIGLVYVSPVFNDYFEKIKTRILWKIQPRFQDKEEAKTESSRKTRSSLGSRFREILVSTLSAQFMVLPLLIYNFGSLSLVSPLANLAVLAVIPATMFFGFITGILGFLSLTVAGVFSWSSWLFLQYEISAIKFFAGLPFAAVAISGTPLILPIVVYVLIGWRLWKKQKASKLTP